MRFLLFTNFCKKTPYFDPHTADPLVNYGNFSCPEFLQNVTK